MQENKLTQLAIDTILKRPYLVLGTRLGGIRTLKIERFGGSDNTTLAEGLRPVIGFLSD